jgi:hypothetical protein
MRRMDAVAGWALVVAVPLAAASAPRWPALLLVGALCAQRRMVVLDVRGGRPLLAFQALVVGGAVALAAV